MRVTAASTSWRSCRRRSTRCDPRRPSAGYQPVLTHTRWCLRKRPANHTERQRNRLRELLTYNLKTVRAYLLKEDFDFLGGYKSASWAGRFLDRWCTQVMRSRIEPMKAVARTLRAHRALSLNWFRAREAISLGATEGLKQHARVGPTGSAALTSSQLLCITPLEPFLSGGYHRFC